MHVAGGALRQALKIVGLPCVMRAEAQRLNRDRRGDLAGEAAANAVGNREHALTDHVPMATRPIDRAPLRVLESANMPAVLVEVGYLTNPAQARLIAGDAFQNLLVQALLDAIVRYRDTLPGGGTR